MVTEMRELRSTLTIMLLTLLAGCAAPPSAPTPEGSLTPSGTFTIREQHVMRLAAGTSGEGTLILQGWQHPFLFEGAKVEVVGKEDVELEGTVYNLEAIEDFEGTYKPVKAEMEAGVGLVGAWARNEHGVLVHLRFKGLDLEVNLEATGAKVTLK
jgi:hypothetical protein